MTVHSFEVKYRFLKPTPQSPPWEGTLVDIAFSKIKKSPLLRGEQGVCQ